MTDYTEANITDIDNVINKAKYLATNKHAHQKYGEKPYSYHLSCVTSILTKYGYAKDESIMAAGWLHDILEDTDTTYEMLASEFGYEIADIVAAVTNEPGKNRVERFRKTAPKILSQKKALVVKLADRIANTESSLHTNQKLYKMG